MRRACDVSVCPSIYISMQTDRRETVVSVCPSIYISMQTDRHTLSVGLPLYIHINAIRPSRNRRVRLPLYIHIKSSRQYHVGMIIIRFALDAPQHAPPSDQGRRAMEHSNAAVRLVAIPPQYLQPIRPHSALYASATSRWATAGPKRRALPSRPDAGTRRAASSCTEAAASAVIVGKAAATTEALFADMPCT